MPKKFWKEVIRPGKYFPRGEDGKPAEVEVTKDRIKHWAKQFLKMIKAGNHVPLPYAHSEEAVPIGKGATSKSPYDCAGYAEDCRVNRKDGSLHMLIEPATEDDEKNFNTKIKHVSIRAKDWVDGAGNKFDDAITHVAACFHGVMNDQKPFVPAEGVALSLEMADSYTEGADATQENSLESAIELLKDYGIDLGSPTPETFLRDLCVALRALKHKEETEEGGDYDERPEGSKTQSPTPIVMSDSLIQFAIDQVKANPEKAWTEDELKQAHAIEEAKKPKLQFSAEQQAALDQLQMVTKKRICTDLSNYVKEMRMPQATAEAVIDQLQTTELQFSADGSVDEAKHPAIFIPISMAENSQRGAVLSGDARALKQTAKELKLSLHTEEHPDDFHMPGEGREPSDEDAEACVKRLLAGA